MNIAIFGLGTVGGTLRDWLSVHTKHNLILIDPYKDLEGDVNKADAAFICVPVDTDEKTWEQDYTELHNAVFSVPTKVPVFIKSTVLPGTCNRLASTRGGPVWSCPEFLTAAQAMYDFEKIPVSCGGGADILSEIFPDKELKLVNNFEAELGKCYHNVFLSIKNYCKNELALIAEANNCSYQQTLKVVLSSELINPVHTRVPGPDGLRGFGGACLDKDAKAFCKWLEDGSNPLKHVVQSVILRNNSFRKDV